MEDFLKYKLRLQSVADELEFVKKQNNVETTQRHLTQVQLVKVREELEQSEKQKLCLLQELGRYQKRVEELEAELLILKQVKSCSEPEIVTIEDDDDEYYCEMLEMSDNMARYLTAVETYEAASDSGVSENMDAMGNVAKNEISSQESQIEIDKPVEIGLALESMEETLAVEPSQEHMSDEHQHTKPFLPVESQVNAAHQESDKIPRRENPEGSASGEICTNQKVCQYCGVRPTNINLHVQLRHKEHFTGWWNCSHCDKKYTNGQSLKFHFESDHCNIRFSCSVCKSLFKTLTSAKLHYRKYHLTEAQINKM